MPRARNWKDITLYRPYKDAKYEHIDELLSDTIDWNLIEILFLNMKKTLGYPWVWSIFIFKTSRYVYLFGIV